MRYLILPVLGNADHQELDYCVLPWCEPLCRFVVSEAHRFRDYMLRDRFQIVKIAWQGLPAVHWYESLPPAVASLPGEDGERLPDAVDEFEYPLRYVQVPDDFAWPPSEGDCSLLVLSNADFLREPIPRQPNLWVLWSTTLLEDGDGYDYHSNAVPLSAFEQYPASVSGLGCDS
jgi:hypothetical protein